MLPRARRWWSPPTTARSRWAATWCRWPPTCSALCAMQSGEGRFRWLHARSGRAGRCWRGGHRPPRRRRLGADPRPDGRRRLVRPGGDRGGRRPARRRGPGGAPPTWRSTTRSTPAPTSWWAGTVPAPRPRCWSRCSPRPTERARRRGAGMFAWRGARGRMDSLCRSPTSSPAGASRSQRPRWSQPRAPGRAPRGRDRRRPGRAAGRAGPGCEAVEQPAKVMRIGSMIKLLLEEVRQSDSDLDEPSRDRLREIYETSVAELSTRAVARPARRARPAGAPVRGHRRAQRVRAAHRQGPAGRLAGGPVPRHPGHAVRPADGRPPAARRDAPAAAAGRGASRPATSTARPGTYL